jgi:hypothetical protein
MASVAKHGLVRGAAGSRGVDGGDALPHRCREPGIHASSDKLVLPYRAIRQEPHGEGVIGRHFRQNLGHDPGIDRRRPLQPAHLARPALDRGKPFGATRNCAAAA